MKSLIIAEKPSVARDIARVMKCGKAGNGYLEGGQYIVTWGLGHLVESWRTRRSMIPDISSGRWRIFPCCRSPLS